MDMKDIPDVNFYKILEDEERMRHDLQKSDLATFLAMSKKFTGDGWIGALNTAAQHINRMLAEAKDDLVDCDPRDLAEREGCVRGLNLAIEALKKTAS